MTQTGRPLRFLAVILVGWTALRVAMLWPAAPAPTALIEALAPRTIAALPFHPLVKGAVSQPLAGPRARAPSMATMATPPRRLIALALAGLVRFGDPQIAAGPPGELLEPPGTPGPMPASLTAQRPRWSVDLWLVARNGRSPRTGFGGGELGGSQVGARIAYTVDRRHHLAAFGRADAPLSGRGREAAVGLDWQPTKLPIRVVAEERIPLDHGKAAPAAGLVGGFGPTDQHGLRLEGYGQAGIIARHGGEGFADGAIRATRPLGKLAGVAFDLGAGTWGGAQRDAARLDIGPTLGATVPIAHHAIRIALDWRARVAGHARPGSGPALTIGASF